MAKVSEAAEDARWLVGWVLARFDALPESPGAGGVR